MTPDEPGSAAANRIALEEALASGPVWLDANTEFYVDPIEIPAYAVLHGAGATSSLRGGGGASILKSGIGSWNGTQGAWLRGFNLKGSATTALKLNFHPAIRVEDITLIGFVGTTGFDFAFVFASTLRGLYSYDSTISGQIFKLGAAFNANHCANWYTNGGATYGLYWDSTSELSLGSSFDALCVQGHATGIYLGPKVSNCRIDAYFENCTTEYTLDTSSERPRGIQWGFRANPLKTKKRGPRDQWYGRFTGNQGNKGHRTTTGTLATTTSSAYLGKTHQAVMTAECPFYAVRVRLLNSSANTQTIDNVAVAPSANFSSNSTPTGSWIQATFGGSASVVLPARLATNQPSITFSDWMPIVSIPRTDGDGRPMLYMRAFNGSSTEATITDGGAFNQAQWNAANSNTLSRLVKGGYDNTGGNYVASAQASFALTTGALLAIDFEYLALGTVLTVSGLGDSITDGTGGPISVMGASWGHRACAALSTPTNPVAWSNLARSGSNTAFFLERLQGLLAGGMRPHVLVYSPFSPNDTTPTQALMDAARARLAQVMELCKTYNIIPVVWTGLPYAYNSTADAFRVAFNNDIRALAQKGVAVVDMDAVMSDGATPARMIRSPVDYTDTNLLHPSDAGVAVMTAAFQEVLAQIVENYFRDLG
jgi:lysophospholipase L1-like esterase